MQSEVRYEGKPVGTIDWEEDAYGAQITIECEMPVDPLTLLRCYGRTADGSLLLGLPEPKGGRLVLRRRLTRETLKEAGCAEKAPHSFYLAERPQANEADAEREQDRETEPVQALHTGDTVLDALIDAGAVRAEMEDGDVILRCAFRNSEPFGLAPAFVLCEVDEDKAQVRWTKKTK